MYYRTGFENALGNVVWAVFYLLALTLLTFRLEKRPHFKIKAPLTIIAELIIVGLMGWGFFELFKVLPRNQFITASIRMINYTLIVVVCAVPLFFCSYARVKEFVFFAVGAFSLEHIGRCLLGIIRYVFKIPYFWGSYGYMLIDLLFISGVELAIFFLSLNKQLRKYRQDIRIDRRVLIVALLNFVVCSILPSLDSNTLDGQTNQFVTLIICNTYSIFSCSLCLFLQVNIFISMRLKQEKALLDIVIKQQNEQRALNAENIDYFNEKLHDIRKQVNLLEKSNEISNENKPLLDNIRKELSLFDTLVKTGNPAIDSIITSNYIIAVENDIDFTYFIDGSCLNFMKTEDTMALFNNLISNAIEASDNEEKGNRVVHLKVYKENRMALIDIRNYCSEEPVFKNGFPVTDKDSRYHGFGMRSIKRIVNRYKGEINIRWKDNYFNVKVLFAIYD